MPNRFLSLFGILLLALPAAAQDRATVFARAAHLRHGINASMWFAQETGHYTADRLSRYTDDGDIALMARLGFDSVRLPIDPAPLEGWPLERTQESVARGGQDAFGTY